KLAAPTLERESLPPYLQKRRWFGVKDQKLQSAQIVNVTPLDGDRDVLLAELDVRTDAGPSRWQMPLGICWDDEPGVGALPSLLALARVRRGRRVGLLPDAFALGWFARRMLAGLANAERLDAPDGQIVFEPMADEAGALRRPDDAQVIWLTPEPCNSSLIRDD